MSTITTFSSVITDIDQWLLDSYSGRGGYASGKYLVPHPRETDDKLQRRKDLARYPNFVRKVVGFYRSALFRDPPQREFGNADWAAFVARAEPTGSDLSGVMRRAWRMAALLGTVWLIVDRPQGKIATQADAQARAPYIVQRLPGALVDSAVDSVGVLQRAVFAETVGGETQYRGWDLNRWWISSDAEGEQIMAQGEHGLGLVPAVPLHSVEPDEVGAVRADPWAWDIVTANFDLYQLMSELREQLRNQTFSILALPVKNREELDRIRDLKISTENALPYDPEGGGQPVYLAPPVTPAQVYEARLAAVVTEIYQAANLEFVGGVQQSGIATAFHFQAANNELAAFGGTVEAAERRISEIVCRWNGVEWDGYISYPDDYHVHDLAEDLKGALDAETLSIGPTFEAELKKYVARGILGQRVDQATWAQIDSEIDAGADPMGDRAQAEAGVVR